MLTFWFFILGIPLTLLGMFGLLLPRQAAMFAIRFPRMTRTGNVLCILGWFWTAWELDNIGIEAFDKFLKRAPFEIFGMNAELVILAAILSVLTCWWMSNLLPLRALSAILMLFPARLFPAVRLEPTAWRLLPVSVAYISAVIGMYMMFYPWRVRQAISFLVTHRSCFAIVSVLFLLTGLSLVICGFAI